MSRKLTTPIPIGTRTDVTIDLVQLVSVRNEDMSVNREKSRIEVHVAYRDSDGRVTRGGRTLTRSLADWPTALRDSVKDLRDLIVVWAEGEGAMPPGVDTEDLD